VNFHILTNNFFSNNHESRMGGREYAAEYFVVIRSSKNNKTYSTLKLPCE